MVLKSRSYKKRSSKRQRFLSHRKRKGGKVIGTGTFGCVFSPPLPCFEEDRPSGNIVSKLMDTEDANAEYSEIEKINSVLSSIPNHRKYFAGEDTKLCQLGDLTEKDIKGKTCELSDFSAKEVLKQIQAGNVPPSGVRLIQQPNMGKQFFDYVMSDIKQPSELSELILSMNNLLENGIVVMNSKGIYHQDIKSPNLLVLEQVPRLIDWGLALVTSNRQMVTNAATQGEKMTDSGSVPMRAYVMFNAPISAPFFYKTAWDGDVTGKYTSTFSRLLNNRINTEQAIDKFISDNRSNGHFEHLWINMVKASIDILKKYNVPGYENLSKSSTEVLSRYLEKLIDTYVSDGEFDNDGFYRDFYNNVDLWGWASCYVNGIEHAPLSLSAEQEKSFHIACARLTIYLFTDGAIRLDPKVMTNIMSEAASAFFEKPRTAKPAFGSSGKPKPVSVKMRREPPSPSTSLPKALRQSALTEQGKMTMAYEHYMRSLGKPKSRLTSLNTGKRSKTTDPVRLGPRKLLSPIKEESPMSKTKRRSKSKSSVKSTYNLRSRKIGGRKTRKGKGGHI